MFGFFKKQKKSSESNDGKSNPGVGAEPGPPFY